MAASSLREHIAEENERKAALHMKWCWNLADAHNAGRLAVEALDANDGVEPMVVVGGGKEYFVADGPCGFAWVKLIPERSGDSRVFANWVTGNAKDRSGNRQDIAAGSRSWRKAYGGGYDMWIGAYNQSIQRKECYARAFADSMRASTGFKFYAESRLD